MSRYSKFYRKSKNRKIAEFLSRASTLDEDDYDRAIDTNKIDSAAISTITTTLVDSNYVATRVTIPTSSDSAGSGSGSGTGNISLTLYDSNGQLPLLATDGTMAYIKDNNDLYIFDSGDGWVNPAEPSNFIIVRAGSFTAPLTGTQSWTPTRTVKLKSWTADVSINSGSGSLVFSVLKNGTSITQGSILSGQTSATGTFSANSVTSSDSITMNIDSGAGTSLSLDIDYV